MKNNYFDFVNRHYSIKKMNLFLTKNKYLIILYDSKNNYYEDIKGNITFNSINNILDIISNIQGTYNVNVMNYYPVCFCNETLVLAFRINNIHHNNLKIVDVNNILDDRKKLYRFHRNNFSAIFISSNIEKEISMSQKYIRRYKFHEKFIKKYFLTYKARKKDEFKELLFNLIPEKKTIIDVSCGDNSDIFEIANRKKYKTIVGNDICINYLKIQNKNNVIFTNDNIESNLIKQKSYDVSFVKNTLHHMNNLLCINNLLDMLDKISNEILIVEIINPKETGGMAKFLNKYLYTIFLKDVGRCYLNENQFKYIINQKFKNSKIEYYKFKNILGEYIIAKISKKES